MPYSECHRHVQPGPKSGRRAVAIMFLPLSPAAKAIPCVAPKVVKPATRRMLVRRGTSPVAVGSAVPEPGKSKAPSPAAPGTKVLSTQPFKMA